MAEISTKPYLIRAIYEWCCDNGYTPHLVVKAGGRARLPMAYVRNGEIVLNVSPTATNGLQMGNDVIEFQARFNGVPEYVVVPVDNVLAIFARETGFVVPFNIGPAAGADADPSGKGAMRAGEDAAADPAEAGVVPARPGQEGPGASQGGHAAGGASTPAGGGDVVDFRAARAARPGLKAVPKRGADDASDVSRSADEEGPEGRGTKAADPAKDDFGDGASAKGNSRSTGGSPVSTVGDAPAPTEGGDAPETEEGGSTPRSRRKPTFRTNSPRRKTPAATDEGAADTPPAATKPKATRSRKSTGGSPAEGDAAAPTSAGAPSPAGASTPAGAPAMSGADGTETGRKSRPGPQQPPVGTRAPVPGAPTTDGPPDAPPPAPPSGGRPRLVRIK